MLTKRIAASGDENDVVYFCHVHKARFDILEQNDRKIEKICVPLASKVQKEGDVGIFGFADLANFWFGFSVFALKNCALSVLVFCAVCGFSPI